MNFRRILTIALCLTGLLAFNLDAQTSKHTVKKKKKQKQEVNFWKEKMWYGGGFNLNFYSTYLPGTSYPGNLFSFGISPLAGYKITPWWSAGPRFEIGYLGGRFDYSPGILKLNGFNFGIGAFTRFKFANVLFAQIEIK